MEKLKYSVQEAEFISDIVNNSEAVFIVGGATQTATDVILTPMYLKGNDSLITAALMAHMKKDERILKIVRKSLQLFNQQYN